MGGSAKGIANTVGRVGSGVLTLGGSEIARNNLPQRSVLNQALNLPGTILTGGQYNPGGIPGLGTGGQATPSIPGPFTLDQVQLAADQQGITDLANSQGQAQTDLGKSQYGQANDFITGDQASRDAARQRLSDALIAQNQATFKQGMAGTLEDLNARHLANGSGVGQEFARQQGNIATNIANEVGTAGARDYTTASNQRAAALQALLGSQSQGLATTQAGGTNALSRGLSLEDFINQANVAKTIGAQAAPQVGNGKGQTGSLLSGIGATAPLIGAAKGFGKAGPAGAVAGGAAPLLTSTIGSNLG